MKYFAVKNHVDSVLYTLPQPPSTIQNIRATPGAFPSKESMRAWCKDPNTTHVFYSTYEPTLSNARLTTNNPVHFMHGWVADYDSPDIDTSNMAELVKHILGRSPGGLAPTWITRTYSGKARAVWEFANPLLLDSEQVFIAFQDRFVKEAKASKLLKGFDGASKNPSTYWELGTEWTKVGPPVDDLVLERVFFEAIKDLDVKVSETKVPIDVVAAKLDEVFPGRWNGPFEIGSRGPLFWINDGIDRPGCQVVENGVVCYSTRAGKSFMSWAEIFGGQFVKQYEEKRLADSVNGVYFDGNKYWIQLSNGEWKAHTKEDYTIRLRLAGFSYNPRKKGDPASEIDEVLRFVQDTRRIDAVSPFVFRKEETITFNGERHLNTPRRYPMNPAQSGDEKDFPWLASYLRNVWDPVIIGGGHPADYFMAWLQRTYKNAHAGFPVSGHALVIAGPAGVGKSLLATYIMRQIFGGGTDAGDFLLAGGGFNKQLAEVGIWWVDDNTSSSNFNDHRKFSEMLKKHVATPMVKHHPKYMDATVLPWFGRLIVTCNTDADSLSIIPSLDGTILDKLMLFKLNEYYKPEFRPNKDQEKLIMDELPFFLRWLLDWTPPKDVMEQNSPRYGVRSYHHPDILKSAREASPDHRLTEILDMWCRQMRLLGEDSEWSGTSTELLARMNMSEEVRSVLRDYTPIKLGKALAKIESYYDPLSRRVLDGKSHYILKFT